jgi:hypothetical protein
VQFVNTAGNAYVGVESSKGSEAAFGNAPYALHLSHQGAYPINFSTNNALRATIDSSGRLLVGTSTARTFFTGGAGDPRIQQDAASFATAGLSLFSSSNGTTESNYLAFGRARGGSLGSSTIVNNGDTLGFISFCGSDGAGGNQQAARIDAFVDGTPGAGDMPGRLVFSITADGSASPTERMKINNGGRLSTYTQDSAACIITSTAAAGTSDSLIVGKNAGNGIDSGTNCFVVLSSGDVRNTNNSYGAISDAKLKENIVDANSQWDDLKALQVRKYNLKEGQTHTQIGLVAQEAELVSPGLVTESPDRDKDGNDLGTVTKSVNYSVLYMKAVKALQEAMERIETLEARLTAAGIK